MRNYLNAFYGILFFIILLLLVSCMEGDSGGMKKRDAADKSTPPVITSDTFIDGSFSYFKNTLVNDGEPITITMWINEDWSDCYSLLIEEYKKYRPNVDVKLKQLPWASYWIRMGSAMRMNMGPDIFHMHPYDIMDYLQYLQPLPEDCFPHDVMAERFSQVESLKINDEYYLFNLGSTTGGIIFNTDMWQAAGLTDTDIPHTWDELRTVAKRLTVRSADGTILQEGFNFNNGADIFLMALQLQQGNPLLSADGKLLNINIRENIDNCLFMRKLISEDKVGTYGVEPMEEMLGTEKAAMIFGWPWIANYLERNYPDINFKFIRIPAWDTAVPPAYNYNNFELSFGINRFSELPQKEAAYDLLLFYLCNDKVLLKVSDQGKLVPSKYSILEDHYAELDDAVKVQAGYLDKTSFIGIHPRTFFQNLTAILIPAIMDEKLPVETILEKTETTVNSSILDYYDVKIP